METRDKNGDTTRHREAARGPPEMIQRLVDRGADLSAVNRRGQTPLLVFLAAKTSVEGLKVLFGSGCNVHASDQDGNTALHYALRDLRFLKMVIRNGGDVNAVNTR